MQIHKQTNSPEFADQACLSSPMLPSSIQSRSKIYTLQPKDTESISSSFPSRNNIRYNNQGQRYLKKQIIQTMLKQEGSTYQCKDYLYSSQATKLLIHPRGVEKNKAQQEELHQSRKSLSSKTTTTTAESSITSSMSSVDRSSSSTSKSKVKVADEVCRHKICEWTYRIVNFFNIERDTVYYSISYLDRFMMYYKTDRHTYKLLATTALFLALKVHHPRKLVLRHVVEDLSKGEFNINDIDQMELIMLMTLSWSLHTPTPKNYVTRLIDMQQPLILVLNKNFHPLNDRDDIECDDQFFDVEKVQPYATFFVELSLFDYYFVTQKQSRIALASILNTMEGLGLFEEILLSDLYQIKRLFYTIVSSMFELIDIDLMKDIESKSNVLEIRTRLWSLYENSDEKMNRNESISFKRSEKSETIMDKILIYSSKDENVQNTSQ